jgi:hypothetical protein
MDWNTTSALTAQRQAELARDAAQERAGRAVRNRSARKGVDDGQVNGDVAARERRRAMPQASGVCRRCGSAVARSNEPVSRHPTSEGTVVYTRCACGLLQVWLDAEPRSARPVTRVRDLEAEVTNELATGS